MFPECIILQHWSLFLNKAKICVIISAFLSGVINALCMLRWWIPNGTDSGLLKAHWGLWMKVYPQSPALYKSLLCLCIGTECTTLIHQHAAKWCNWFLLVLFGHVSYQGGPVAPFQMFCYEMQRCRLGEERDRTNQLEWKEAETHRALNIFVMQAWGVPYIETDDWWLTKQRLPDWALYIIYNFGLEIVNV